MSYLIGVGLSVAGSVCTNIGVNIQKYSQNMNAEGRLEDRRPYFKQPLWLIGLVLVIGGSCGDFLALGFAAQSIIAPIGAVSLIANLFFATFFLGETVTRTDVLATLTIVCGVVLAVVFGNTDDVERSVQQLVDLFKNVEFIIYAIVCGLVAIVLYSYLKFVEPMKQTIDEKEDSLKLIIKTPKPSLDNDSNLSSNPQEILKLHKELRNLSPRYRWHVKYHAFAYCTLSGLLGGQSVLCAKPVSEILRETVAGNNGFVTFVPYVFLVAMFFFIFCQLHFLARALESFDALYCVPVFQCAFVITSAVGGGLYFQEFNDFSTTQAVLFMLGFAITVVGIFVLSQRTITSERAFKNSLMGTFSMIQLLDHQGVSDMANEVTFDQFLLYGSSVPGDVDNTKGTSTTVQNGKPTPV